MASVVGSGSVSGTGFAIPGLERLIWYFMRVSGVLLIVLVGGHLFITHYLNVPSETTFAFVSARWANPYWRTFDWLLLMIALWHGVLGLRYSIMDYFRAPAARTAGYAVMWVLGIVFMALGTITVFTFDAAEAALNVGPLSDAYWIVDVIGFSLYAFALITYIAIVVLIISAIQALVRSEVPIYNGGPGQYAWAMHRAAGIGILFFLLVHIIDISLIGLGKNIYDASVAFYAQPALVPMEILLVGAVVYHTLNGIRVMTIDFSRGGYRREKTSFAIVLLLTILLTLPSAWFIIQHEL